MSATTGPVAGVRAPGVVQQGGASLSGAVARISARLHAADAPLIRRPASSRPVCPPIPKRAQRTETVVTVAGAERLPADPYLCHPFVRLCVVDARSGHLLRTESIGASDSPAGGRGRRRGERRGRRSRLERRDGADDRGSGSDSDSGAGTVSQGSDLDSPPADADGFPPRDANAASVVRPDGTSARVTPQSLRAVPPKSTLPSRQEDALPGQEAWACAWNAEVAFPVSPAFLREHDTLLLFEVVDANGRGPSARRSADHLHRAAWGFLHLPSLPAPPSSRAGAPLSPVKVQLFAPPALRAPGARAQLAAVAPGAEGGGDPSSQIPDLFLATLATPRFPIRASLVVHLSSREVPRRVERVPLRPRRANEVEHMPLPASAIRAVFADRDPVQDAAGGRNGGNGPAGAAAAGTGGGKGGAGPAPAKSGSGQAPHRAQHTARALRRRRMPENACVPPTEAAGLLALGGRCSALAFSPTGSLLAAAVCTEEGSQHHYTVALVDPTAGDVLCALRGHKGRVYSLAFSANGAWLVSASADGTARVWPAGALVAAAKAGATDPRLVPTVLRSSPPSFLYTACFLETNGPAPRRRAGRASRASRADDSDSDSSGDGGRRGGGGGGGEGGADPLAVITGGFDGSLRVWAAPSGDGSLAATVAVGGGGSEVENGSSVEDGGDGSDADGASFAQSGSGVGRINATAFDRTRSRLYVGDSRGVVRVYKVDTRSPLHAESYTPIREAFGQRDRRGPLRGQARPVAGIALDPDGVHLAVATHGSQACVYDNKTQRVVCTLTGIKCEAGVAPLLFSPDGAYVAGGGDDGRMCVWQRVPSPIPRSLTRPSLHVCPADACGPCPRAARRRWPRGG